MKRILRGAGPAGVCRGSRQPPICRAISRYAPAYNPIYNWTGFYLGINGGGGWGARSGTASTNSTSPAA